MTSTRRNGLGVAGDHADRHDSAQEKVDFINVQCPLLTVISFFYTNAIIFIFRRVRSSSKRGSTLLCRTPFRNITAISPKKTSETSYLSVVWLSNKSPSLYWKASLMFLGRTASKCGPSEDFIVPSSLRTFLHRRIERLLSLESTREGGGVLRMTVKKRQSS